MTILTAARSAVQTLRSGPEDPRVPLTKAHLMDWLIGPKSEAGVNVNERTAFNFSAVYRAVALVADSLAALPLQSYKDDTDTQMPRRMPESILLKPHPDLTQFEWMELIMVHLLTWGNAYLRILRNSAGNPVELWPIDPSRVLTGRARDGHKVYAIDRAQTLGSEAEDDASILERLPLSDKEILHIPAMGYDGVVGMSPIACARQGIGLGLAAEKFGAKLFASGTMLTGVLSTEQRLRDGQADELRQLWKERYSGSENAHDVAVLGYGTTFTPISMNPVDAQFLESRKFQVTEIARWYGVPPHMLMDTEKSTSWGTGIAEQTQGFTKFTITPYWAIRIEQRITKILAEMRYAQFNLDGLLRGDQGARYEAYMKGRQWGWLSVNDVRRLENLPPIPNGDRYLEPVNYHEAGEEPKPQPQPTGSQDDQLSGLAA